MPTKNVQIDVNDKKCPGYHCRCMNLDGECPNMHYADCPIHNEYLISMKKNVQMNSDEKVMKEFDRTFQQDKTGEKVANWLFAVPAYLYPKEEQSAMYVKIATPDDVKTFLRSALSKARKDADEKARKEVGKHIFSIFKVQNEMIEKLPMWGGLINKFNVTQITNSSFKEISSLTGLDKK